MFVSQLCDRATIQEHSRTSYSRMISAARPSPAAATCSRRAVPLSESAAFLAFALPTRPWPASTADSGPSECAAPASEWVFLRQSTDCAPPGTGRPPGRANGARFIRTPTSSVLLAPALPNPPLTEVLKARAPAPPRLESLEEDPPPRPPPPPLLLLPAPRDAAPLDGGTGGASAAV